MKLKPLVITVCILSACLLASFFNLCVLCLSASKKNDAGGISTCIGKPITENNRGTMRIEPMQNNTASITP